jgi:peptidoglycan/xylan/chitin deacetylase (PgdA/CDA1 family)
MSDQQIVPVLLYHSVIAGGSPEHQGWITSPEVFAEHMAYLHDEGYKTLTVSEYAAQLVAPMTEAPEKTVVITFDDGFADFTEHAVPVLKRYGLTSTMYVVTGCVGSTSTWLESAGEGDRPMMGWSDIESLHDAGVEVGAHTHSHPQLDIIDKATAAEEIRRSRGVLEDRLGREVPSFAYPFGFHGPRIRAIVEATGFSSACAVKDAFSGPGDDPFAISRVIVSGDTGVGTLADLLAGRGRPVAWQGERTSTKAFRIARRSAAKARGLKSGYPQSRMGGRNTGEGARPRRHTHGP